MKSRNRPIHLANATTSTDRYYQLLLLEPTLQQSIFYNELFKKWEKQSMVCGAFVWR